MKVRSHLDITPSEKFLRDINKIIKDNSPLHDLVDQVLVMAYAMEDGNSPDIATEFLVIDLDGEEVTIDNAIADYNRNRRDFLHQGPYNQKWDTFIKDRVKLLLTNYLIVAYEQESDQVS